ncbi:uncharacterized protein LOC108622755, partial [Ceratina calcarata]|uniref:Uncharacterized protein LOC108622755 n=1 Tax=Ceratina calcarata TaxID=156304 RepID=A0AAJ7N4D2_9HYME
DLLTGSETSEQAIEIRKSLTLVLSQYGFPLRKWASNDPTVVSYDKDSSNNQIEIRPTDRESKTLGLLWSAETDELRYALTNPRPNKITKRNILSEIAQIFDPLGLIGPITVKAKLIMQELWQLQVHWDESLPQDFHTRWINYRQELNDLVSLSIPRRVAGDLTQTIELHGFSDASEKAYGASVYLRTRTDTGSWQSHLLCAKSRVAPLKTISLPRLELCGALLLARLANKVKTALNIDNLRESYWTDSTITLAWIRNEPCRWKTFVANRVSELQQLTSSNHWRHVMSEDNPADLISRGTNLSSIKNCSLWWHGPSWLLRECNEWPSSEATPEIVPEARQTTTTHLVASEIPAIDEFDLISRYSSYCKLRRVTAYCLRFIVKLRSKIRTSSAEDNQKTGPITTIELSQAKRVLVGIVQRAHFARELESLIQNKSISLGGRLVRRTLAQEGIEWHLIPPYAPHFGELWEGGVKQVKTHLRRVIGEQRLTYEELYTILTQIEACLNSRPLHPLSSDPNDLTPLTPGHFLIGDSLMALPQPDMTTIKQNRLNRYQLIQQTVQHFWKRWHQEYLHELQQRHKWKLDSSGNIKIGSLVLIKEDNIPPMKWRLGRI